MAHMKMFDANTGYGWGYHGAVFQLFQTADGGQTWKPVQLPALPTDAVRQNGPGGWYYIHPTFFNDTQGWLIWLTKGIVHVLETTDGGATWHQTSFPIDPSVSNVDATTFSTNREGWLLLTGGGQTGSAAKFLYQTTNGGARWRLVNSSQAQLTHNGFHTEMDFTADGKSGIMATPDPITTQIAVQVTQDAGRHWSDEAVPFQDGSKQVQNVQLLDVQAVDKTQNRVVAVVQTASGPLLSVSTEIQKDTWQTTFTTVGQVEDIAWFSTDSALVLERQAGKETLLRTVDGGTSWYAAGVIPNNLVGQTASVSQLTVGNASSWWILLQNSRLQPSLIGTTDGGSQWKSM